MSYVCEKCGKGRMAGHNVSHAKNRTVKYTVPNLHKLSLGRGKPSVQLCTTCLRQVKPLTVTASAKSSK